MSYKAHPNYEPPQPPPPEYSTHYPPPPPPESNSYYNSDTNNNYQNYESHPVKKSSAGEKWNTKPKYQDLWAAILFLIHFGAYVVASYFGLKELADTKTIETSGLLVLIQKMLKPIIYSALIGFVLSLVYMVFMQQFPKILIKVTLWLSIALYFLAAIFFGYLRLYIYAIIFAIIGLLYAFCAYSWRSRIPFAAILLKTVTSVTKKYYGTLVISFVGLLLELGWTAWFVITAYGWVQKFISSGVCKTTETGRFGCSNANLYLILLFLVFSFYWTSQVIKTIVHVTDCGTYASYYFLEGTAQGVGSTPTLSSLKRACTTSFGSVCFGSLIIAALNTLKAILRTLANSDDGILGFVAACFACILGLIEALIEYFNYYAYIQVAIYGKPFIRAAKDTWRLVKEHGIDAIINDNLVGNVLAMAAIFIGGICALFGFVYITYLEPGLFTGDQMALSSALIIIISFIFGFTLTSVMLQPINSGVSTIFVALAEDPDALRQTKPRLYQRIVETWPQVAY
ncbi:24015_t:CDS:2 [Entrophospora sp. SA101]|nr:13398_t:CDS:2 [Entrophospora sp. SA101]CAJ0636344.1 12370_t:CDS:2 [Entrophospora sp. SA101]CAJ0747252.1 24015_t:CDS:2 [Entrophospora sp. SA101]CAJ0826819.1 3425_t:CDS:2 [Entrophospora sp. SA101]CAJ0838246.1 14845_t:CDS:2 [Entrophospora sp. SA101]